jgi:NTE family protein
MIGLALSGGGSRAIAFHLGCLRALNDLGILDKIGVLSTISGGSVIGAYYAYTPMKSFDEFEADIQTFLKRGLQLSIAIELAKPHNFIPCLANFLIIQIQEVAGFFSSSLPKFQRYPSRTDMFQRVLERDMFPKLALSSPRRNNLNIVIGACELRTGSSFRFGNEKSGGWRQGEVIKGNFDVAFAVAASAAYPIFLPALDRTWRFRKKDQEMNQRVLLTDGGVYDNLGTQVLEPGRNPEVSLHSFPCDYLISCNAGQGQDSGTRLPLAFLSRVASSFAVVHRRVQDTAMTRMHHLKEAGIISGFAMPYLGQQDNNLPWRPYALRAREDVIDYPTNFAAMSDEWIEKLSERGEQLTKLLVTHYLRDLI